MKTLKTKKDFYKFFQAIPNEKWARGALCSHGRHCALGHLGVRVKTQDDFEDTPTGKALLRLGGTAQDLIDANDSGYYNDLPFNDQDDAKRTIKESVLAYIQDL